MKFSTYLLFLVIFIAPINSLYVVPFLTREGDGSLIRPYTSIRQALAHREHDSRQHVTIKLYPTNHFIETVHLRQIHSHTRLTTMNKTEADYYDGFIRHQHVYPRLPTARISGGTRLTNWTSIGNNTYSTVVPTSIYVNQLFINNERIVQTRIPTNFSDYLHYVAPLNDSVLDKYGFQYAPGQFDYKYLADAMVVIYHRYTESHHYIDRIIPSNNTILFTNPSGTPIEQPNVETKQRFHIENLCEALISNTFCFVNETKTIYLMTNGSYNPMNVEVITPINETVLLISGDSPTNPVEDILIDNVAIQHSSWKIGRTQTGEGMWAAMFYYAAVEIKNALSITISNVEISHTGAYAVHIEEATTDVCLMESIITDTGAGGIWIGSWSVPTTILARSNKILSNEISYGGNVFPSAVGVLVTCAFDILIADNAVHHHRYSGISIGAQNDYNPSLTGNILVLHNYVHDIGQHVLCDLGGIYMIGVQTGTLIFGNVIKNVFSYATFMWGIYLDNCASNIIVSNNLVYNRGWSGLFQHLGGNNTIINNVFARSSLLGPPSTGDPMPDGNVRIAVGENHTSWTYTSNIVYDTYRGANHSAVMLPRNVIASFDNNIYYNPYGVSLTFGSNQTTFADWQKTGQDNHSLIADPLFIGDVNQCDFFTIQSSSPAARLGYQNLTKPSKWTPGCDFDFINQFYRW